MCTVYMYCVQVPYTSVCIDDSKSGNSIPEVVAIALCYVFIRKTYPGSNPNPESRKATEAQARTNPDIS